MDETAILPVSIPGFSVPFACNPNHKSKCKTQIGCRCIVWCCEGLGWRLAFVFMRAGRSTVRRNQSGRTSCCVLHWSPSAIDKKLLCLQSIRPNDNTQNNDLYLLPYPPIPKNVDKARFRQHTVTANVLEPGQYCAYYWIPVMLSSPYRAVYIASTFQCKDHKTTNISSSIV